MGKKSAKKKPWSQKVGENPSGKETEPKARLLPEYRLAEPESDQCKKAWLILKHAHESAQSLLRAFELARGMRGRPRGMTTDEEQDLLRAMLVMSAAGLDAMTKQLLRESLPRLTKKHDAVRRGLEKFLARRIRGSPDSIDEISGAHFLARIFAAPTQQAQVIEEYIAELTGVSLQSPAELMKAANALGIDPKDVGIVPTALRPIFDIRNKIVHELDINLDAERRNRNVRRRTVMTKHARTLLRIAEQMLKRADETLRQSTA